MLTLQHRHQSEPSTRILTLMLYKNVALIRSDFKVVWMSGTINAPGSPPGPSAGGMYIDNNETPGCEGTNLNCYPLKWETIPELWQNAGVSWQVYQDSGERELDFLHVF